jgi:hypothetical protein
MKTDWCDVVSKSDNLIMMKAMVATDPIAATHFGKDSIQYHVFASYIMCLKGELFDKKGGLARLALDWFC